MPTDLHELLSDAAGPPSRPPDIAQAWKQGRRRRNARRILEVAVPVAAAVAVIVIAATQIGSGGGESRVRVINPAAHPPTSSTTTTTTGRTAPPGWKLFASPGGDLTLFYPADWHVAAANLTPNLTDPREIVSLGTFPMAPADHNCAQVPVNALEALTPTDAFVSIEERHAYVPGSEPSRPTRFDATSGTDVKKGDVAACLNHPLAGSGRWIAFEDGGRGFYAIIAVGSDASPARAAQAFEILNSFRVPPASP